MVLIPGYVNLLIVALTFCKRVLFTIKNKKMKETSINKKNIAKNIVQITLQNLTKHKPLEIR